MKKISRLCSALVCSMILILNSCGNNDPAPNNTDPIVTEPGTPLGSSASSSIGPAGGTITSSDGKVSIVIPEGALPANTTISIQPITNNGPLGLGLGYRFEPEGTTFAKPITINFLYDDKLLDDASEEFLWIITQASDGTWNAMLKSETNKTTKTVSVQTTHFSDWAIARFIDLSLVPSSKTIGKNKKVDLMLTGFRRDKVSEDYEFAPLVKINDNNLESLTPLMPIANDIEKRNLQFSVKSWSLNGTTAPTSGNFGALTASNLTATYTAPGQRPTRNVVAVTVNLETTNPSGAKMNFSVTSNITIVDAEQFILLTVDGVSYEYYQWGFNGSIPPDPNDVRIANCTYDPEEDILSFGGGHYLNSSTQVSAIGIQLENPSEGSFSLKCMYQDGNDDMTFFIGTADKVYELTRVVKTSDGSRCDIEYTCADMQLTLYMYEDKPMGNVRGYFSGTLYERTDDTENNCKSSIPHTVEAEFWLTRAN